jgi:hypothetical protein
LQEQLQTGIEIILARDKEIIALRRELAAAQARIKELESGFDTPPPPGETPRMHPSDIHKVKNQEAYVGALQQCIYETERALTAANERVAEAIHDKEVVEIELHLKNARIAEQAAQLAEAERREEVAPKEPDTWQILMKELRETSEELGKAKMRVVELERQIETQ